jgi:hypothetical protein
MATATATWTGIETIEGIILGNIVPETLPFAQLDADTQRDVISAIDAAVEDIEGVVLDKYPDLDDEGQRAARLREYKREFLSRTEDSLRDAYASYFDSLHGVYIRNGQNGRSYTIDSSGCVNAA